VGQLSFYSADASPPRVADLAGALCGPGQAVGFGAGTAVRLSVTAGERWRAVALVTAFADRDVDAVLAGSDGDWLVRTAFRSDLVPLAAAWTRDGRGKPGTVGVKSVPSDFRLDGVTLRLWALAAGRWSATGYLLGLDPASPQTHRPLVTALVRAGVSPALLASTDSGADGHPALRVSGTRRLARLVELVGVPPRGVSGHDWPAVVPVHRGRASIGA
jgi:hypothetical protein